VPYDLWQLSAMVSQKLKVFYLLASMAGNRLGMNLFSWSFKFPEFKSLIVVSIIVSWGNLLTLQIFRLHL
jgi:hypothetical protein